MRFAYVVVLFDRNPEKTVVWLIINLVAATSLVVYVFLSADGQSKLGIKLLAIVAAVIVVANAVVEALQKDRP